MTIDGATFLSLVLTTFFIGAILGFIGAGGAGVLLGILAGPFGLPIGQAIGTALAAMFVVTVAGAISHFREGNVSSRIGFIVGVSGIMGAALGASLGQDVPESWLRLGSGLALWTLAALVWLRTRMVTSGRIAQSVDEGVASPPRPVRDIASSVGLGLTGGVSAGFFGVGMAPYLQLGFLTVHRLTLRQTVGTTMWSLVFISGSAAIVLAGHGQVSGPYLLGSIVGLSLGSFLGAKMTARAPVPALRLAIVLVPVVAGAMVIFS
jgi:uncharacterized protein